MKEGIAIIPIKRKHQFNVQTCYSTCLQCFEWRFPQVERSGVLFLTQFVRSSEAHGLRRYSARGQLALQCGLQATIHSRIGSR